MQHKSLGENTYSKNINKQNKLEIITVSKHLTRLWRGYLQQKHQIISRFINNVKQLLFFLRVYKMAKITKERWEANGIQVMVYKANGNR